MYISVFIINILTLLREHILFFYYLIVIVHVVHTSTCNWEISIAVNAFKKKAKDTNMTKWTLRIKSII